MIKIKAKRSGKRTVKEFVEEIISVTIADEWMISLPYLLGHFGISQEEYFRYCYLNKEPIRSEYTSMDTVELISFLNAAGVDSIGKSFLEHGYYFPEESLYALQDLFYSVMFSRIQGHMVDRDLLETSITGCSEYIDAFEFYFDHMFNQKESIEFAVGLFLKEIHVPDNSLSKRILKDYLKNLFSNRTILWEDFRKAMVRKLKTKSLEWGFIKEDEVFIDVTGMGQEFLNAMEVFGLSGGKLPSRSEIQKKYRLLMKKYHPDLNPEGQEKARIVNRAYSLLAEYFSRQIL